MVSYTEQVDHCPKSMQMPCSPATGGHMQGRELQDDNRCIHGGGSKQSSAASVHRRRLGIGQGFRSRIDHRHAGKLGA
jgi:hypothetical protein